MRAFDPLFRGRRRRIMRRRGTNGIGVIGLVGLGYVVYRLMQTERGRAMKDNIVDQMRHLGERMQSRERSIRSQSSGISAQTF